ncbi:MAG: hypothetical protein Alpg2KO_09630 [Alphaproteobacteria bacterium]
MQPQQRNLNKYRGATGISYGLLVGLISVFALVSVTSTGDNTQSLFGSVSTTLQTVADENATVAASPEQAAAPSPTPVTPRASCKEILDAGEDSGDGIYTITLPGPDEFDAYCDMTFDGGGWTLVSHRQPSSTDVEVTTTVTPSTLGDVVTSARWVELRDNATVLYTHNVPNSFHATVDIAKAKTANCTTLTNNLTASRLIHAETSGCSATGIDYCFFGFNGSRRNQLYQWCNGATSFWLQPAPGSPTSPAETLILYVR